MAVPIASFVTVKVDGQAWGILAPQDLQTAVAQELAQVPIAVRSFVTDHEDIFSQMLTGNYLKYTYHATIVVQTSVEYAQAADVTSLVRHAFFDVTGLMPDSASEVVADASAAEPTAPLSTSWTDSITAGASAVGASLSSVVTAAHDDVTGFVSGLGFDLKLLLLGLVALLVVVVLVVGWSPNAPGLVPRL